MGWIDSVGRLKGWSEEYTAYAKSNRCQQCNALLVTLFGAGVPRFYAADGSRTIWGRPHTLECPSCGHKWKIRADSRSIAKPEGAATVSITETSRSEEFFGEDRRVIDNSASATQISRRFSFVREWSKSYKIELQHIKKDGHEFFLGVGETAALKLVSEQALQRTYSVTQDTKEICQEQVTCTVPEHTKLTIIVRWKRIWQHGVVTVSREGNRLEIPFQIAVGVTFDQSQIDERAPERPRSF